jgi:hypothetical protein
MEAMKHLIIGIFTVFAVCQSFAQETETTDFYRQIKEHDISTILTADSVLDYDGNKWERTDILGFIGDNYQRFFIHFISIIQNPNNQYEYLTYGKTKVKENICTFQGTIKIESSKVYNETEFAVQKQGYAVCSVMLYEDKKEKSTGFIKGNLTIRFFIDKNGKIEYDDLESHSDGFANRQFVGNWTSYKTKVSKKCHWGDYRIPESGDLNTGAGEFWINPKYIKNGWESYVLAYNTFPETDKALKVRKKEKEKWWQKCQN